MGCGPRNPLQDGRPGQCDPTANANQKGPCCSSIGWCGNSHNHCECYGCIDFRQSEISKQIEKAIRGVLTQKLILDVKEIPQQIQVAVLAVLNGARIDTSNVHLKAQILSILKEIIGDNIK